MNKRELRSRMRGVRREISPRERRTAALRLIRVARQSGLLLRYRRIGFYIPMGEELDLLPLLNHALWLGKSCFLPVVPPRFRRRLWFSRLSGRQRWYLNRFGIHEHWAPRQISARQLDLLLVPLVAFDEDGYRLGMGGGFYDATLAYLKQRRFWQKPLVAGVGYECQKTKRVPHDPWDMPLDAVITEKRLYRFPRPQKK